MLVLEKELSLAPPPEEKSENTCWRCWTELGNSHGTFGFHLLSAEMIGVASVH